MRAPDPGSVPPFSEELAFQLAQIAKAARRGHASDAAAAAFRRRAHDNLAALSRGDHPSNDEGESQWPARRKRSA